MQGSKITICSILTAIFLLVSCTPQHATHGIAYDDIHNDLQQSIAKNKSLSKNSNHLPSAVSNALLPTMTPQEDASKASPVHRFDITADKMPAKAFFMGLVEGTPYNMVVNPDVAGNVTVNLKNVTVDEAMEVVRDVYGYEYKKSSFGYEVLPQEMETMIFNVNYLDVKRTGKSTTELSSGQLSEKVGTFNSGATSNTPTPTPTDTAGTSPPSGSNVDTRSVENFWHDLDLTLKAMVGTADGRSVVVNSQGGIVIAHAYPKELHQVARYLDRIQSNMNRQVILEAKILEVSLNDAFQAGIDWNAFGFGDETNGGISQFATNTFDGTDMQDFNNMFTLNVGKGRFNVLIKLLQTQGNVQVISSPRISTVNNQKAVIKVGQDEFFVTGVSTENTVTANSTIPTQDVSLTPFFSGVTFDVTPQISSEENVILHIHPSVSVVTQQTKNITLGTTASNTANTLTLPLALSTIRESDNIVRAKSGQVIVIAGLMQNNMIEETAGEPGVSRLPFIGALFRRTYQTSQKSELVILLRPIIVNLNAWNDDLENTEHSFHKLKRGFHAGGLPEVFGNDAENEKT